MPALIPPVVPAGRLSRSAPPELVADDLLLRPWRESDVAAVVAAYGDPDIQRWHGRSMTSSEARQWIRSWAEQWAAETGAGWAVESGGVPVGRTGLRTMDLEQGTGEAAYWVLPEARGRGVASRALAAVAGWAFGTVGLHRIEVQHSTANPGSCRVATRAGFEPEGVRHSAARHLDGWHDMHVHARIAHPA